MHGESTEPMSSARRAAGTCCRCARPTNAGPVIADPLSDPRDAIVLCGGTCNRSLLILSSSATKAAGLKREQQLSLWRLLMRSSCL
eukprot:6204011-Pleurochrysis_carterae.AAC.3